MPKLDFSRRQILRGLGGFSFALPAVYPRAGRAAEAGVPKRLVIVFQPEGRWLPPGDNPDAWWPVRGRSNAATDFSCDGTPVAPLEPLKKKVTLVRGINAESTRSEGGCFHLVSMPHLLTGGPKSAPVQYRHPVTNELVTTPSGISVDQLIGKAIRGNAPLTSYELGVKATNTVELTCMSFSQAGAGRYPQNSPYKAFQAMFGAGAAAPGSDLAKAAEEAQKRRLSVLDLVAADLVSARCQMGNDGRQKLDQHLANIRDIEKQLVELGAKKSTDPTLKVGPEWDPNVLTNHPEKIPDFVQMQMNLATAALTSDVLRVVTIHLGASSNHMTFPFVTGLNPKLFTTVHHDFAHIEGASKNSGLSNSECRLEYKKVQTWFTAQFAYLLDKMDRVKEPNGASLLDNSLVMHISEMGHGYHSRNDFPIVLGGGAQGAIKMGAYFDLNATYKNVYGNMAKTTGGDAVSLTGRSLNDLHFTICRAFGINLDRFGNAAAWRGTIPELLA